MEVQTIQRYIHTSPRKLRLVADMVRKMEPERALDILRMTPKYAAKDLVKAIETVLANAKTAGMDTQKIGFKKLEINESMKMRRFMAGTRGRVKPYKRRMAHIKIVLSDEEISEKGKVKREKSVEVARVKSQESSEEKNAEEKPASAKASAGEKGEAK